MRWPGSSACCRHVALAERTLTVVFSEFGRRVEENGSAGTDHGTAGPMPPLGPRKARRRAGDSVAVRLTTATCATPSNSATSMQRCWKTGCSRRRNRSGIYEAVQEVYAMKGWMLVAAPCRWSPSLWPPDWTPVVDGPGVLPGLAARRRPSHTAQNLLGHVAGGSLHASADADSAALGMQPGCGTVRPCLAARPARSDRGAAPGAHRDGARRRIDAAHGNTQEALLAPRAL